MRVGTWNLAGRWTARHRAFLERAACDVWLLTEVPEAFVLSQGVTARSERMGPGKAWAAVWSSSDLSVVPSVHPAAAFALIDGVLVCCCVLPWRGGRRFWPDDGADVASITLAARDRLREGLLAAQGDVVWGGDWNHALEGKEYAGTLAGRAAVLDLVAQLDLQVPTAGLPHARPGLSSIDHIAVPKGWRVTSATRLVGESGDGRLSDHDAYVVDVERP